MSKFPSGTTAHNIVNWRGLTFIKTHSINATWGNQETPTANERYKLGGSYIPDSELADSNGSGPLQITSAKEVDWEVDPYITMSKYTGDILSLIRPVGGRPGC